MAEPGRPNILIIMSDQQNGRTFDPGSSVRLPTLRRLASKGVTFQRAYTPTPMCAPARASFMSGLYCHANGMWNNNHTPAAMRLDLNPSVRLWSENLAAAGYRLQHLGKWHVSAKRSAADFGWQELVPVQVGHPTPAYDLADAYYHEREGWPPRLVYGTTSTAPERLPDGELATRAVAAIEANAGSDQPWCLFLAWSDPHDPYVAHERYLHQYDLDSIPKPASFDDDLRDKPNLYRRIREQAWSGFDWRRYGQTILHYNAACTFLDEQLARVLEALERSGAAENTIVIYTSDHGDYAGAHGLLTKGVPGFDEAYRVPLIIRWPRRISRPGQVCDEFVTLMDIGPMLLELAGAAPLTGIHGRSMLPLLQGETPEDWPQEFYGEFLGHEHFYTQRQIVTKEAKFIWNSFDDDELYDLRQDPFETRNLNRDPGNESLKHDLMERLWKWALQTRDIIDNSYVMNALMPIGPERVRAMLRGR